jgi:hypothetical protein
MEGASAEIEPLLHERSGVPVKVEFATTATILERLKNIVPLPDELQVRTTFTVAVLNGAASADSAAKVVRVLTSTEAAAAHERSGASPLLK